MPDSRDGRASALPFASPRPLPFSVAIVPVTPFQQNCALVWDQASRRAAVCDPGGDVPRILACIAELGLAIEKIVLTHGHLDHAGGAAALRDALCRDGRAPPIEGPHRHDQPLLANLRLQGQQFGMAGLRDVEPDRWLDDGDAITLAGHEFQVLHCPGHTPGHVAFVHAAQDFALVGDVLFRGSIGRTDFPYADPAQLLRSIHDKLMPLPDALAFSCGHGPGSTIGVERRSNPFLA